MKEQLIQILGLKADATEEQIVAAVSGQSAKLAEKLEGDKRERAINKKISDSGGALSREQAIIALEQQAHAENLAKAKKK